MTDPSRLAAGPESGGDGPARGAAPADDFILPFQIDDVGLRGRLIRLGPAVDQILTRHDYPEPVAALLGEALALAAALAGALKYDGVFTLQIKGDGPVRMLVADVGSTGDMRGYAQFNALEIAAAGDPTEAPVPRLLRSGYLAFTVDQGPDTERYQGIVELSGATLAECAHHYFQQSEQLQAGVRIACRRASASGGSSVWRAGAVMLQRLPGESEIDDPAADEAAEDAWRRVLLLLGSGRPSELTDPALPAETLLLRLFHESGVRVYPRASLRDRCRCARARVAGMLSSLSQTEVAELADDGEIVVTCEFCNMHYRFDETELAALYAGA